MFCRKYILRNFVKFTGKQPRQSLFFNKVAGLNWFCFANQLTGFYIWGTQAFNGLTKESNFRQVDTRTKTPRYKI